MADSKKGKKVARKSSVFSRLVSIFTRHQRRDDGSSRAHGGSSSHHKSIVVLKAKSMNDLSFPSFETWHTVTSPATDDLENVSGIEVAPQLTQSTESVFEQSEDDSIVASSKAEMTVPESVGSGSSSAPQTTALPSHVLVNRKGVLTSSSFEEADSDLERPQLRRHRRPPSEDDDGLPWSPAGSLPSTPPVAMLYGSLAAGINGDQRTIGSSRTYMSASDSMLSSIRNSDNSLLSGRSSDTEEEFFRDPWRALQSPGSRRVLSSDSDSDAEVLDLDCITKTEALANPAARHRQLLKPKKSRPTVPLMPKVEEKNVLELASNFCESIAPIATITSAVASDAGNVGGMHRKITAVQSMPLSDRESISLAIDSRPRSSSDAAGTSVPPASDSNMDTDKSTPVGNVSISYAKDMDAAVAAKQAELLCNNSAEGVSRCSSGSFVLPPFVQSSETHPSMKVRASALVITPLPSKDKLGHDRAVVPNFLPKRGSLLSGLLANLDDINTSLQPNELTGDVLAKDSKVAAVNPDGPLDTLSKLQEEPPDSITGVVDRTVRAAFPEAVIISTGAIKSGAAVFQEVGSCTAVEPVIQIEAAPGTNGTATGGAASVKLFAPEGPPTGAAALANYKKMFGSRLSPSFLPSPASGAALPDDHGNSDGLSKGGDHSAALPLALASAQQQDTGSSFPSASPLMPNVTSVINAATVPNVTSVINAATVPNVTSVINATTVPNVTSVINATTVPNVTSAASKWQRNASKKGPPTMPKHSNDVPAADPSPAAGPLPAAGSQSRAPAADGAATSKQTVKESATKSSLQRGIADREPTSNLKKICARAEDVMNTNQAETQSKTPVLPLLNKDGTAGTAGNSMSHALASTAFHLPASAVSHDSRIATAFSKPIDIVKSTSRPMSWSKNIVVDSPQPGGPALQSAPQSQETPQPRTERSAVLQPADPVSPLVHPTDAKHVPSASADDKTAAGTKAQDEYKRLSVKDMVSMKATHPAITTTAGAATNSAVATAHSTATAVTVASPAALVIAKEPALPKAVSSLSAAQSGGEQKASRPAMRAVASLPVHREAPAALSVTTASAMSAHVSPDVRPMASGVRAKTVLGYVKGSAAVGKMKAATAISGIPVDASAAVDTTVSAMHRAQTELIGSAVINASAMPSRSASVTRPAAGGTSKSAATSRTIAASVRAAPAAGRTEPASTDAPVDQQGDTDLHATTTAAALPNAAPAADIKAEGEKIASVKDRLKLFQL